MKYRVLALGLILVCCGTVLAEEGMWPPEQLPELAARLKEAGLQIDPERLTSLMEHPMNAVVSLGGCTASFVSPKGLVITNHHCAYGSIQYNSTPENNLLEKGFLAKNLGDELPASPGSRVYVTVEFRDVTSQVLGDMPKDLSGKKRFDQIEKRRKEIVAKCEEKEGYRCRVASYYGGLKYSLVRQLELRDVRLVYAPAAGIGVFGGDIDNWMWPRHTGDYSFYRAYVGRDGKPADHSKENVPFEPKHFLRVSTDGLKEGDYAMVVGYPGSTSRYRLSTEVEDVFHKGYPRRIKAYSDWLAVIDEASAERPEAAMKYAGLKSGLNNGLKNNQGMLEGFAKSNMLDKKRALETELASWVGSDQKRKATYGEALHELSLRLEEDRGNQQRDSRYSMLRRAQLFAGARRLYRLANEKEKPDMERESGYQERDFKRIRQSMQAMDRRFDAKVDSAVWKHFILAYHELPSGSRVSEFDEWFKLTPGVDPGSSLDKKLKGMYENTSLDKVESRLKLLEASVQDLQTSSDPFLRLAVHLFESDQRLEEESKENTGNIQQLRPLFMEALTAFLREKGGSVYPDANGTLRVTFGNVRGYSPRDSVTHTPFTTMRGIIEKDTGKEPFNTPAPALALMKQEQFGNYRDSALNSVPINFLTTVDTTGGNSGSPTLNARGELVGLLFDGNYESMIADWDYLPQITRSIHVDIRYVLWVMAEVDGAHSLLKEMGVQPSE